jgi:hypothetical protein
MTWSSSWPFLSFPFLSSFEDTKMSGTTSSSSKGVVVVVGETGGNMIREALSRSEPKRAIHDFQTKNDLNDEASKPILPLLDLHGLSRSEIYEGVLNVLKDDLIRRVETLDDKGQDSLNIERTLKGHWKDIERTLKGHWKDIECTLNGHLKGHWMHIERTAQWMNIRLNRLDLLLDKTFPYVSLPELQAVPMAVLRKHPNVPAQYLQRLSAAPDLYRVRPAIPFLFLLG